MLVLCYEANCSSTTDSPAVLGGGGVAVGRGVATPGSGTTEGMGGGGVVMGCFEEEEVNITCIPSHFTCISHSENAVQQLVVVGLKTCADVCTHTCSTHAVLLTDSPLTGVC